MRKEDSDMKQFIKKGLCLTLLALCGVSAFAGGKVEVADDVSNGTITGQVSGTQVTLTVTPAEGFYIRKADLVAEKTFMPVAASRSTVPMADQLTIEGEDPADLSQQRTYTVTLPSEEYDVLVHANFTQRTMITREMVTVSETRFVYNTDVQRPSVSVGRLLEGRDYEVVFSDPASTEAGNYWLTVNGLSTYQGTHSFTYSIKRGGNAEVNSEILNGSVKAEVDGLTLTVTVIPADGYYFQKKNLRVDKTYMPVAARSTTPISDELVIVGDDPADLSLPRTYTVTMPGWEFDAWVDATFTPRTPLTDVMVKLSASSFVYNGNDQKPTVTLSGMTEGLDYTLIFAETEWKDVGSYSLSVRGESTYKGTVTKTFTITKAMPVVSAPVANMLTFNREQQVLAQAGEVEGGEMLYSLEKNGTYTTTVPQVMDAGTYTLYYKVVGDSNHFDSEVASIDVSIGAKVVSNPTIEFSQQTFVYDGSAKEPSVTVKDGTDVIPASEYSVSYASNVNAGEAEVVISDNEAGNYTVSGKTTFAIEKAPAVVTTAPVAAVLTYNREAQALVEAGKADGGEILYSLDKEASFATAIPAVADVGTYTVYYKVVGDSNHFDSEVASIDVSIGAKVVSNPTIEFSQQTFVYDGSAKEPSVTVKDGTDVIPASEYSVSYASNVNAGEATVAVSDNEGGNYTISGQATFAIEKASTAVAVAPQAKSLTYNRQAQALVEAGTGEGGEMHYALSADGPFSTVIPTGTDAGTYTVYYKVIGDANHSDSEVASLSVTLVSMMIDAPVIELGQQTYVYDGTAKEPPVTVKDGTDVIPASEYSVSYASNVNAGEATVAVSDNEGGNYTVSGSASFVIEKAIAQVMTAPMAKTLTYSGEEQVLIEQGVVEGGQMLYALDANGTFSEIVPVGLNAATYTVYYKVTGDANHEGIEVASVSVTIAPKMLDAPVIALSEQTYVYDGTAKEPSVAVMDGTSVIPASEYSVSYASNVNAGEAVVTVADEEGGNYVVDGQSTFTIMKATLNAIADNKMMEKGEPMPELTLRYKGFVNDETEEVILKQAVAMCEEITDTVAGIYQIVVSGGEAQNYDFAYVNGTLTVFVPVALADEAGNEVEASVTMGEDTCHVVITELTAEMLNGTQEIPVELKSGEGDTYQVTEVASEAFDEMPSNVIIELPDGISTTNPVTNVINGDGTCETLDLTDVDGFGTKKTIEVEEVIYEREVDSDVMTVCLPYSMEVPEDVSVFQLDADADGSVSFVTLEGDSLEAYQPYLMQPKEESLSRRASSSSETATLSLGAKNVTISPAKEDAVVSAGVFKLCGTVHGLTHAEGLALKAYVMQPDHTWQMTASSAPEDAGKTYLGAFQAYMQLVGGTGNEVIGTEINGTTAILHVTREAKPAADGWYDLMGRKLPGKPAKKGLYIYQGKKVRL